MRRVKPSRSAKRLQAKEAAAPPKAASIFATSRKPFVFLLAVAIVGTCVVWIITRKFSAATPMATQSAARKAMQRGDYTAALQLLEQLLQQEGDAPELLLKAGDAAARLNRFQEAIQFYDRVADQHPREAAAARWSAGEVLLEMRQMTPAILRFSQGVELDPQQTSARARLVYLLNLCGRRWEAAPHLLELVKQGKFSIQQLIYLGNLSKSIENEKELELFLNSAPEDTMPLIGLARIRIRAGAFDEARVLLEKTLKQHPDQIEAHVQLGKLFLSTTPEELAQWNQRLPSSANSHPDIWWIRAQWARDQSQNTICLRCLGELLRIDPDHLAGLNMATQMQQKLAGQDHAQPLLNRAALIEKLLMALEQSMVNEWEYARRTSNGSMDSMLARSPRDLEPIASAAEFTLQLGRVWESVAWSQHGLSIDASNMQLKNVLKRALALRSPESPRSQAQELSSVIEEWLRYELPNRSDLPQTAAVDRDTSASKRAQDNEFKAAFEELSDPFDFTYFASRTMPTDGRKMFEFTGGGIGILDYDNDGWPDVYLSQGCTWPFDGRDAVHSDRLKRNRGKQAIGDAQHYAQVDVQSDAAQHAFVGFQDVSQAARVIEADFGQGIAIGDINSDGFDDIYVCNVGLNRLWINQGDGTYSDGSTLLMNRSASWTASAAIADLNGDGLAEVYDANYVEGADVFSRLCNFRGLDRACSPLNFQRARGCLWMADGQGRFREVGRQVLESTVQEGNALGLVVFRLAGRKTPSIFVANDQVANLMLSSIPNPDSPLGIRLEDSALVSGLAYDENGKAQACMGIAAGDVNADGAIDLIVTNYYDETNTLYLQLEDGSFRDATRSSGLVAPSLKMLGFGAQLIDSTLSGQSDLVVLNGHVDDLTHAGIPFQMRPQFFSGSTNAKFVEQAPASSYFQKPRLGRALARADFDGDGREDLVASELDGPTAILRNVSKAGHFVCFKLVGVNSHRDAIGAEVVITIGEKKWTQQVIAGCGYMASNSKELHFGLGHANRVDRVEIRWPDGSEQSFEDLPVDSNWLVIEGQTVMHNRERR